MNGPEHNLDEDPSTKNVAIGRRCLEIGGTNPSTKNVAIGHTGFGITPENDHR